MKQRKTRKKSKNKSREIKNLKKSFHSGLYIQDNKKERELSRVLISSLKIDILSTIYRALSRCGFSYLLQKCFKCLTEFATQLFCSREYCCNPICQEMTHKRRMGRKWSRFLKLGDEIGYFCFPLPKRKWTQKELKQVRNYIKNMLKNHLDGRLLALVRWHWFGDGFFLCNTRKSCKYKGKSKRLKDKIICENFHTSCKYKEKINNPYFPHLNVLCSTGYIMSEELEKIKKLYRRWLKRNFPVSAKMSVVWYKYSNEPQQKMHWFSYIFRNTFRILEGNEELAISLKGFRNDVSWGNFKNVPYEIPESYAKFHKEIISKEVLRFWGGQCPECGARDIRTMKGITYIYNTKQWTHIGLRIFKRVIQKKD